jgi:outer membrane receptor protein involved in Fe transport
MKMQSIIFPVSYFRIMLLSFISIFSAVTLNAQGISLQAKIVDKNQAPLSGEILLLNPTDSSLIKAAPFTNGMAQIDEVPAAASYLAKISVDGYRDNYVPFTPKDGSFNMGTITMEKIVVGAEARVIAKAKIFRRTAEGSTKMSVENTMLGNSISAKEIFAKSPGLSVAGNRVFLFGKGEALVFLNGKQTTFERLLSIPVSSIKEIEIISNPSAKYDARGRAVVNIITKKSDMEGWQVTSTHHSTFAYNYLHTYQSDLYYRKRKFNAFLSYQNADLGNDWTQTLAKYTFTNNVGIKSTSETKYQQTGIVPGANTYRTGIGYDLNDKTDISIQFDGLYILNLLDVGIYNQYYPPTGNPFFIHVHNDGSSRQKNSSLNVNLNRRLDSLGSTFFFGIQKNWFSNNLDDNLRQEIKPSMRNSYLHNENKNRIKLFITQADWTKVRNANSTFDAGLKYSHVFSNSRAAVTARQETDPVWYDVPGLKNDFKYDETVSAGYLQMKGRINSHFTYVAGVRGEHSLITGKSAIDTVHKDGLVINSNYFNLFPKFKIDQKINENWTVSYNYSRSIARPIYQDLDPFLWYQDSLTTVVGNPFLTPEISNNFEIITGYKNLLWTIGYSHRVNTSRVYPAKGINGDNSVQFIRENMKLLNFYYTAVDFSIDKKNFSSTNRLQLNYGKFNDNRPRFINSVTPIPQLQFTSYSQYIIPKLFTIDLQLEHTTKGSSGITVILPRGFATVGLSRDFFKGKLSTSLMFNDIFNSYNARSERLIANGVDKGNIYNTLNAFINTHFVRATLVYKFGRLKSANYNNRAVNEKEYNRIRK